MRYGYFIFALAYGGCIVSNAQITDTLSRKNQLHEVIISGRHINDSLMDAPAAIGILSAKALQRNNSADVSTVLNLVPGVLMQSANITTNRISIRGIGARTTYGTNKIRAFYGNIPLTSGNSETVIDDIDLENIDQIEIIKGPLSSVYGAGLGGAILLTPKTSGNYARAGVTYGSFGLMKHSANVAADRKWGSLNINYHKLDTDGWRQNSDYDREGVTLGGALFRNKRGQLTYLGNYTRMKAYIASSIDRKTYNENPRVAASTWLASQGYKDYESVLGGLAYDMKLSKRISNSTSVFVNYKDNYETRPFDILGQYTFAYGGRTQFSGNFNVGKMHSSFITGIEYFSDDYAGRNLENRYKQNNGNGSLQGNLIASADQKRNFYNAFAQIRLAFSKTWELQSGVNLNQTKFSLNNTFPVESAFKETYRYDAIWSPQASVLYKPDALKTLYISASRGFSLPSVEETLTDVGTINTAIKPESGYNYELGAKLYFFNKALYAETAIYLMDIKNLLVAERIGDDQYIGVNAGSTRHQGVELLLNYNLAVSQKIIFTPYASASIGRYRFREFNDFGKDYAGNALTGVPSGTASAGFTFSVAGWYLNADYYYTDDIPLNDANTAFSHSYNLLNLKSGYELSVIKNLDAQFGVGSNNITNTHYAALILPNATAVGNATPRYFYPGLPVNFYGQFSVKYRLCND